LTGSSPRWPLLLLVVSALSIVLSVGFVLANPDSYLAILVLLPGVGVGVVSLAIFFNAFYLKESTKPSVFDRARVSRCPYCGHLSARIVESELVSGEETKTAYTAGNRFSGDAVFGTKAPGMENRMTKQEIPTEELEFGRNMRCSHCGRTWTKMHIDEEPAPFSTREDDSAPELGEPGDVEG